jgi:hypothetical protein
MVIGGFAALALLCLLVLLSSIIPDREQGLMSGDQLITKGTAVVSQETPASYTSTAEQASALLNCGPAISVPAEEDSWIDENSDSNNFGDDSILKVRSQGPSDNFRALVRFELAKLPQGCTVQSATLSLYAASATTGRFLEAQQISGVWLEDAATWSSQPQTMGPGVTISSGSGYREWDVTAQVQAMYDAGANNGFLIRDTSEGGNGFEQQFHSREKGENPPSLIITFGPAGG